MEVAMPDFSLGHVCQGFWRITQHLAHGLKALLEIHSVSDDVREAATTYARYILADLKALEGRVLDLAAPKAPVTMDVRNLKGRWPETPMPFNPADMLVSTREAQDGVMTVRLDSRSPQMADFWLQFDLVKQGAVPFGWDVV
jgi:hypothetical protein